ncbi:MAG TPA: hypothetical protein VF503_26990 [Sphingobium sp.]|uniref:hypothetical protein n=1 Tax=Sphingobium sp. TaxID=1912891 RepID=UPI002ED68BC4
MNFWTIEDMNAGLCDLEDLGNPKPAAVAVPVAPIVADAPPLALRDLLRNDARQAYIELGGVAYLKRNPELLDKILAKAVVPEPASSTVSIRLDEMPWLSAQRHAYRLGADASKLIETGLAISDATPKIAPGVETVHGDSGLPEVGRTRDPGESEGK